MNRIVAAADHLGDFPEMGSVAQDSRHAGLRSLFERPYRIYYRIWGDHVEVVSVEDTRRGEQPDWLRRPRDGDEENFKLEPSKN